MKKVFEVLGEMLKTLLEMIFKLALKVFILLLYCTSSILETIFKHLTESLKKHI
ncbi:MAG: hypothetical protein WC223_10865 [Bacteroidales bacterium]|jgi:hypothetical protein